MTRFPTLLALSSLLALPALARAQTTDEARALAGRNLSATEASRSAPPRTIPGATDEARALAGRMLPQSSPGPARTIQAVGSTDEARAVAGGVIASAPAAMHEAVANCGKSCNCGHPG